MWRGMFPQLRILDMQKKMMVLVHGWYCQQLSQEYQPFIFDRMEFLGAFHRAVLSPRSFASVQTCAESEAPILILMSELFF